MRIDVIDDTVSVIKDGSITVNERYGAFTNNNLRLGSYGHDDSYWATNDIVGTASFELFADFFAANITGYGNHLSSQLEYFPNATASMEKSIYEYAGVAYEP